MKRAYAVALTLSLCFALTPAMANSVSYIAHRAHSCGTGENTLAAIQTSSAKGAQFFELDVRVSTDGIAYLYHDQEVGKTDLDKLSYQDIRELVGEERSPRLRDSLTDLPADTRVILDLKNFGITQNQSVIETLLDTDIAAHQIILQSENIHLLSALRDDYPEARYFLLARLKRKPLFFRIPSAKGLLDLTNSFQLDGISIKGRLTVDRTYIETLKSGGAEVFVWTINDPGRANHYRQAGADGIITDYPLLLADAGGSRSTLATQCDEQ